MRDGGTTVDALVSAQARRTPHAPAVADRCGQLNYAELEERSSRLAHYLVYKGVSPGMAVGVALEPSVALAVSILAVWKAGGVYLPLEPGYPAARLGRMLTDAQSRIAIIHSALSDGVRGQVACTVYLDAEAEWIARQPATPPTLAPVRADLACLLYTSGSTGTPKGVMLGHTALLNKLTHPGTWGVVTDRCRALLLTSPAFDASLVQLFLPLAHGGFVLAMDSQERLDPARVWTAVRDHGTTVLDCTPSWLLAMLEAAPKGVPLQRIVLGGEILTPALARRVRDRFPAAQLVNLYGPTEACIDALAHPLAAADFESDHIPIGRPLPGYRAQVLDTQLRPVAPGQAGELYIGGVGLAHGYWGDALATQARFVPDPVLRGDRLYRTGDLARERPDGAFEFLGRADHQVKLRGQRIELGEIESVLARIPGVTAAAVKAWPAAQEGDALLAAYLVLAPCVTAQQVRGALRTELPAHMVPAAIVPLEVLPLSATGKVDRAALPEVARAPENPATRPRDAIERDLLALWRDVLGTGHVGVHDNFFELGGHSLSAVRLAARISEHFGIDLPLTALLAGPTIADLAIALLRGMRLGEQCRVLQLASQPAREPPLFLLPPGAGVGLVYAGLARELSGCVPTVALQAVGLERSPPGSTSMAQLVAHFIEDVQRLQPEGPLRLGGYSAGGTVAHEMARQLQRLGRPVSQLLLIDPYCADLSDSPDRARPEAGEAAFWTACRDMVWDAMGLQGRAAEPVLAAARLLWTQGLGQPGWQRESPAGRALLARVRRELPAAVDVGVFVLLLEGVANLWHAYAGHAVRPLEGFEGQAWFIQPEADAAPFRGVRLAHWRKLVGGLQPRLVPGEHPTLMHRADSIAAIGAHVRAVLAQEETA